MLLTIDAGNTRTKWAVFNSHGEIRQQNACLNSELATVNFSPATLGHDSVVISNVAGSQHAALLTEILSPYQLPVLWVKASSSACGVVNRYEKPEALGSDRWAALIAAWHIHHTPCIVVSAGTAVTIDAINPREPNQAPYGEFIGGLILPGLSLMQQSLGLATAQLPKTDTYESLTTASPESIFARNTTAAIYNGALHAILGAIEHMTAALNQQSNQPPRIMIGGGNAKIIADALTHCVTNQVSIVDNLVLQGLYLIHTNEK